MSPFEAITNRLQLHIAKSQLEAHQVVVIPTETVYGLAANAFSDTAIQKIYDIKNRPSTNPLIVHMASKDQLFQVAKNIPEAALVLAKSFWPGPLTLVLEKKETIPFKITAGKDTVGVRVPNHPLTLRLLNKLAFPLVAPSANRSNHISPTTSGHVRASLGVKTPFILEGGRCKKGIESTIVGFENGQPVLYRLGAIDVAAIEEVLGTELNHGLVGKSVSPGQSKTHYAPQSPCVITQQVQAVVKSHTGQKLGVLFFATNSIGDASIPYRVLSPTGNLEEAAANLYKALHELDAMALDLIVLERLPGSGLAAAINDRLSRAAAR